MAVLQATGGQTAPDDSDPEASETARLAAAMPADETQLLYSICLHGRADLGLAPDEYAALTMVLLRLLAFKPAGMPPPSAEKKTLNNAPTALVQPAEAVSELAPAARIAAPWEDEPVAPTQATNPEQLVVPPGQVLPVRDSRPPTVPPDDEDFESNQAPAIADVAPAATKVVAVPVRNQSEGRADAPPNTTSANFVPTEEGDFWHATVQQLIASEAIHAFVRELALQSQLIARDTDQWLLRVERESLNQPGTRERLTAALVAAGHAVRLAVEVGRVSDCPARRNAAASAEKQLAAEQIILGQPFVQAMMKDFGAKIVPGSIKPL
jgi:DNA polymerase III subunit gamma/tau